MHPHAASVLDRLSRPARPGRAAPRLGFGLAALDDALGGGLEAGGLHEVRAPLARDLGAALAVVLALAATARAVLGRARVLWVTDPAVLPDAGFLYPDGLMQFGLDPAALALVQPLDLKGALWAADEGARCPGLAAVVLQVKGNPARLDRVATRRLLLHGRESGTPVLLLRQSGAAEPGAALTRWRAEPRPSPPDAAYPQGVGLPHLRLVLERARDGRTGAWNLVWNPKRREFAHGPRQEAPDPGAGLPASSHRPDRPRPVGDVVDLRRTP